MLTEEEKKEKARAYGRAYYAANRERHAALCRRWQAENRDRWLKLLRASAHRGRGAGDVGAEALDEHQRRYGKRCAYCGSRKKISIDHIVPLSKGGKHELANIQWLCIPCNSAKWNFLPEEFARRQGRLL